jgi:hypothetical protein
MTDRKPLEAMGEGHGVPVFEARRPVVGATAGNDDNDNPEELDGGHDGFRFTKDTHGTDVDEQGISEKPGCYTLTTRSRTIIRMELG